LEPSRLLVLILSFVSLLTSSIVYARKSKEEKAAERAAYWGVFADVYRAEMALSRVPSKPQIARDAVTSAMSHIVAVDQTAAASFRAVAVDLGNVRSLIDQNLMATAEANLNLVHKHLIEDYASHVAPVLAPRAETGEKLYIEYCTSCHGNGLGKAGQLTGQLRVVPAPFNQKGFGKIQSPFGTYAVTIHGVDHSEMVSMLDIMDVDQLWAIAFYVASLPHKAQAGDQANLVAQTFKDWMRANNAEFSLSKLAISSDDELISHIKKLGVNCGECAQELAYVRTVWALGGQAGRIGDITKTPRERAETRALVILLISVIAVSAGFIFVLRSRGRVE
jgi:mono/diheme cytochrome c family protein